MDVLKVFNLSCMISTVQNIKLYTSLIAKMLILIEAAEPTRLNPTVGFTKAVST